MANRATEPHPVVDGCRSGNRTLLLTRSMGRVQLEAGPAGGFVLDTHISKARPAVVDCEDLRRDPLDRPVGDSARSFSADVRRRRFVGLAWIPGARSFC